MKKCIKQIKSQPLKTISDIDEYKNTNGCFAEIQRQILPGIGNGALKTPCCLYFT